MKRTHIHFTLCSNRKWRIPLLLSLIVGMIASPAQDKSNRTANSSADFGCEFRWEVAGARLAYLLSGTGGDGPRLRRLILEAYHLRNFCLLHLDLGASDAERLELAKYVKAEAGVREFRNVMVVGKPDPVTYKGPTMIARTHHAVAILLKKANDTVEEGQVGLVY